MKKAKRSNLSFLDYFYYPYDGFCLLDNSKIESCDELIFYSTPRTNPNIFQKLMKEDDSKKTTTTKKGT